MPALAYPGVIYCSGCGRALLQVDDHPNVKKGVWMMCTHKYVHWDSERNGHECRFYGKKIFIKPVICG